VKKYTYIAFLIVVSFSLAAFSPNIKPVFGVKVVVIDAGHGGKDPGCHGSKHKEKDVALAVALKLGKYIEENLKDVKVVYTRSTDVFVELQERAEIANKAKADLFISIHCNSACVRDKKLKKDVCRDQVCGAETYVMGIKNEKGKLDIAKRENSAILLEDNYVQKYEGFDPNSDESYIIMSMFADTYLDQSLNFASKTQKQYSKHASRVDKGVKRASLWVLWRTYMPSVLTEIGYLTNLEEEQFLGSEKGQDYVASGLFKAFREYKDEVEGNVKKYDDPLEKREPYKMTRDDSSEVEKQKLASKTEKTDTAISKSVNAKQEDNGQGTSDPKVNDNKKTNEGVKSTELAAKNEGKEIKESVKPSVVYKVQLMSSDKKIPLNSDKLKNVQKPGEYMDNGVYKYTAGEFSKKQEAVELQNALRKGGFKDAFVIATQDGKRVPLK
jgi:N-acetylmuramoyl-L-alanine amidase